MTSPLFPYSFIATFLIAYLLLLNPATLPERLAELRLTQFNLALRGLSHSGASHDLLWNASSAHRLNEQLRRLPEDEIGIDKFASRIVLRQAFQQRAEPLLVIAKGKSSCK